MFLITVLFIVGFAALLFGADFLVSGSSALARRFRISDAVIGLTIVAFGTSMPEFIVNVSAAAQGSGDIALSNVIGSNIFNILVILGCSALIMPLPVAAAQRYVDIPVVILSAVAVFLLAHDFFISGGEATQISRMDGCVMLVLFAGYMFYLIRTALRNRSSVSGHDCHTSSVKPKKMWFIVFQIIIGLLCLVVGGRTIVWSAVNIAEYLGISERVVGLTIVSAGTSLPELATSVVAAIRRKADIAVTNIVGSNIFNVMFVLGVTPLIRPVPVASYALPDFILNIIVSVFLFLIVLAPKHRIGRIPATLMLLTYIIYVMLLIR